MFRIAFAVAIAVLAVLVPAAPAGPQAQSTIALPPEFRPEGIASGPKDSFYVGSIPQGSVYRGSYRTGEGDVLVPPHLGRNHIGLKVDRKFDRLFVAGGGGPSRGIFVYDSETGEDIAAFMLPEAGFINDVVLTKRAAYFTDSVVQQLYRVRIGKRGQLGEPEAIAITGDLQYGPEFNANGIEWTGRRLIVVQNNTGELFTVNPRTGSSREIDLGGDTLENGDGLLLRGRTLYVVQNELNKVAVVKLKRRARSGRVRDELTDTRLDVPTTIAPFKQFIYAVNARFNQPDVSDDDIVRLRP